MYVYNVSRRASEVNHRTDFFVNHRALISFKVNFGKKKTKQFWFLLENFHIPIHLLISRLNGDGFTANETLIQTIGTISVSTCRPAYCFRKKTHITYIGCLYLNQQKCEKGSILPNQNIFSQFEIRKRCAF